MQTAETFNGKLRTGTFSRLRSIANRFSGVFKTLVAGIAVTLAGTASADSYTDTGTGITWYYETLPDSTDISIVRGSGQAAVVGATGEVTVPATLNGHAVKRIGQYAFYSCANITKVTLPENLTYIGHHAFSGCSKLAKVVIGNKVTEIDCLAFNNCSKLTSVSLPSSLTTLGYSAFQDCWNYCKL